MLGFWRGRRSTEVKVRYVSKLGYEEGKKEVNNERKGGGGRGMFLQLRYTSIIIFLLFTCSFMNVSTNTSPDIQWQPSQADQGQHESAFTSAAIL